MIDEVVKVGVLNYCKTIIEEAITISEQSEQREEQFREIAIRTEERLTTARTFSKILGLEEEFQKIFEKEPEKKGLAEKEFNQI